LSPLPASAGTCESATNPQRRPRWPRRALRGRRLAARDPAPRAGERCGLTAGAVGHGHDVTLANGTDPAAVAGVDLLPGQRKTLTGGGLAVDVGVSMFRLLWGDNPGGMAIGGSCGAWIPASTQAWEVEGGGSTMLDGTASGFYLRLNIGGGGAVTGLPIKRSTAGSSRIP
jgi:hypothetical protein